LLKKAFANELPESIKGRGKQGFGIPLGAWFRGPLYEWANDLLLSSRSPLNQWFDNKIISTLLAEHRAGRTDHGKRLYALSMLALWKNHHN